MTVSINDIMKLLRPGISYAMFLESDHPDRDRIKAGVALNDQINTESFIFRGLEVDIDNHSETCGQLVPIWAFSPEKYESLLNDHPQRDEIKWCLAERERLCGA